MIAAAAILAPTIASYLGGLFKNKSSSSTQSQLDPNYAGIQNLVLQNIRSRLQGGSSLPAGYETGGIRNINHTFDLVGQQAQNNLTARGLGGSPIAGAADTHTALARGGEISRFQESLPLVQRQLQNEDLGFAQNALNFGGRGSQTVQQTGGGQAGGFENLAGMLGYLYGNGAFGGRGGVGIGGGGSPAMPGTY